MSEETPLLKSLRRLPLEIAREHSGEERITLVQYLAAEGPDGRFFIESLEEDGFFSSLEEYAAYTKKNFEPRCDTLEVPYTLRPCKHMKLESPSANQILIDAYENQDAPGEYDVESDAPSLQGLLDWWFKHHTKGWWVPDYERVIVLLPEERKELYALVTGRTWGEGEPDLEVNFDDFEDAEDAPVAAEA